MFTINRALRVAFKFTVIFLFGFASHAAHAQSQNDAKLYFFTNDGCAPCLMVEPNIQALQRSGYPVQTVKQSDYPEFARQLGVDRTPTVVMIHNNRITHRHSGLIDGPDLQRWFAAVGITRPPAFEPKPVPKFDSRRRSLPLARSQDIPRKSQNVGTKVVLDRQVRPVDPNVEPIASFSSPTMHRGTARPRTAAEQRALLATVKIRVEDADGISFATGTVIHTHGTESLVMTCGHVFRDSKGQGKITAEYDFYGNKHTAPGRLIDYDSDARDVGLVVIKTQRPLPAVPLADKYASVTAGLDVFSIGCDHGQDPTIRHTQIKNRAAYDGALKYDIFGRPVDGRSGGGLFTRGGALIGVCNSAAVQVDEGIYTALNTLHWQVATTGLSHLFESSGDRIANNNASDPARRFAEVGGSDAGFATEIQETRNQRSAIRRPRARSSMAPIPIPTRNQVAGNRPLNETDRSPESSPDRSSYQVVIEVRSTRDPSQSERITIDDPTPELIQYLGRMNQQ
jgi:hypothetical protein